MPIDLFPTNVLEPIANTPPAQPDAGQNVVRLSTFRGSEAVDLGSPFDFQPPPKPADVEAARSQWLGPTYQAITDAAGEGGVPSFGDQFTAEAALSMLPALLIGAVAKPAVAFLYKLLDKLPAEVRRPFERNVGLLIDQALAASSAVVMPLVSETVATASGPLPVSSQLNIQAYAQLEESCAETATATLLKYAGTPVPLDAVDTQAAWALSANGLTDEELLRNGLSLINGPGDLTKLKTFLANKLPVMVSVGWKDGGGHTVVVTGYDDRTGALTIDDWKADGTTSQVKYETFAADWSRHMNWMTVVSPQRDTRLAALQQQASGLRRPDQIYTGLTLSDFWVDQDGKVFVEGAYRYVTGDTDITLRVNFNQEEDGVARQLGGNLAIRRQVASGWWVGMTIDKVSLADRTDDWKSFATSPLALYGDLKAPGFELKAGAQEGGFQASLTADLSRLMAGLGLSVNYSRDQDGQFRLFASITGTS
ncbi:MAG TPA: papain-like cysteine protease family protein [Kofleriaceae bacterium]|jgi:hypothetical protein